MQWLTQYLVLVCPKGDAIDDVNSLEKKQILDYPLKQSIQQSVNTRSETTVMVIDDGSQ